MSFKNRNELFIGLVGAVGTDVHLAAQTIIKEFRSVGYTAHEIRLSTLMTQIDKSEKLNVTEEVLETKRIEVFMGAGNKLRELRNDGDAVALLALAEIKVLRAANNGTEEEQAFNNAYIINSLKHPDEIARLKSIYGDAFITISIYSPKHHRKENLIEATIKRNKGIIPQNLDEQVNEILTKDEKEENNKLGQNVRETFPLADVFIAENKMMEQQIQRFIKLLFGHFYTTPTVDEQSMFFAYAASLRSSDLSRQVGAIITDDNGNVIAIGCNDVPQPGGNIYWEGQNERDYRDWSKERKDYNAITIKKNIEELTCKLIDDKILSSEYAEMPRNEVIDKITKLLKGSGISSAIEYGRVVHAEMNAISNAVIRGQTTNLTSIYCTTFPCHMCARHIISSGIKRVVFIEPYPKSLTKELYKDMVVIDHNKNNTDPKAINFEAFVGIAPRIYMSLFNKEGIKRKDNDGYRLNWNPEKALPKIASNYNTYIERELIFIKCLHEIIEKFNNEATKE